MTDFDSWRARSPFYDDSHEALAQSVRRFVAREIAPFIDHWEAEGELPRDLHRKAAEAGILGLRYPEEYGGHSKGFDIFHGLTQTEELAAVGAGGLGLADDARHRPSAGAGAGQRGPQAARCAAGAGGREDHRARHNRALGRVGRRGPQDPGQRVGDHYVVNGSKMFITSGMRADWLTCAVRTGGSARGASRCC